MTIELIAKACAIVAFLGAILRWIVSVYFKKANELELVKANYKDKQDEVMKTEINNLKSSSGLFRQELNDFKLKLAEHSGQMRENSKAMERVEKQWERTAQHLQERYTALEGAEVIKIKDNTFIFKTRK